MAAWMLGATVFALLLCVAAAAGEQVQRLTQRATRAPWVAALILAVAWPMMAPWVLREFEAPMAIPVVVDGTMATPATIIAGGLPSVTSVWNERVSLALLALWTVTSVCLLLRFALTARWLSRVTRTAQGMELDGEPVLVTESLGPAVVGLWRPRVVVPRWFLQLDQSLRTLVLRHEREHCLSRDPQLVWLAGLAVALMPWNPGVWFLSRRLRLALEIDCDARTLGRDTSMEKYGKLLLLIAQRQSGSPLVTMLAESTSHLSRRITAMQMTPLRRPAVRVALFAGVASAAIVVACSPRIAADLTGPGQRPVSATAVKLEAEKHGPGDVYFESQVEEPVHAAQGSTGPVYPAELRARGVTGRVLAMFVVNPDGLADTSSLKISKADDPQFEAAVREALPRMRFVAAEIGGRKVKQLVQQPFQFDLGRPAKADVPAGLATVLTPGSRSDGTLKPATVPAPVFAAGTVVPVYPAALKARGVEGQVNVMFVLNRDGSADMSSLKVIKSDDPAFTEAVKTALADMRFVPARVEGRPVRQLVQLPFQFSSSR